MSSLPAPVLPVTALALAEPERCLPWELNGAAVIKYGTESRNRTSCYRTSRVNLLLMPPLCHRGNFASHSPSSRRVHVSHVVLRPLFPAKCGNPPATMCRSVFFRRRWRQPGIGHLARIHQGSRPTPSVPTSKANIFSLSL